MEECGGCREVWWVAEGCGGVQCISCLVNNVIMHLFRLIVLLVSRTAVMIVTKYCAIDLSFSTAALCHNIW